ncbi:hypothetical protein N7508_001704 [Penicillium antarcticum]|uniref:uncharacterized protein n=1 Tax=Penicillium antarcticum TaxID=416450 RepID=UPI002384A37D|nr:uncharacterized protein N7508_001704 [Penicillium antarcticum]KAJ5317196.1 hypothetical protein N7508_001704 [Penicillium antarcticum]
MKLPAGVPADEWDEFHDAILIDEIVRCGYLGVIWGINGGATTGGAPIASYGTPEQRRHQTPALMLLASLPRQKRVMMGKHWVINVEKNWITQGQLATHALCAARTGPPGTKGLKVFILDMKMPGIQGNKMYNSGVSSSGSTFIDLQDAVVPAENIPGKENQGFEIIMSTFTHSRLWVGITALRLGRVALEDSYQHALRRETFGKKLFENQAVGLKFSKMA